MDTPVVVLLIVSLLATAALIAIGTGRGGVHRTQLRAIRHRQAEIEAKLDAVLAHLGISLPAPEYPEVERFLAEGSLVPAVRAYRDATGAGLKEAKDAVDEIARRRGLSLR